MNLIPFTFNHSSVRVIDKDGEPWFVGRDIASILAYKEPHKAIQRHCRGGTKHPIPTDTR